MLASLIRQFNVDVNIVQGNMSHTHGGAYGTLILQLDGDEAIVDEAIQFLNEKDVRTEVIDND